MAAIVLQIISPVLDHILRNEEAGFLPGNYYVDHVNTICIRTKESMEYKMSLYLL